MVSIPVPNKDESQKDFISRCIPIVMDEGTTDDQKQAAAICYSIWKRKDKHSDSKEGKIYLTLNANLNCSYKADLLNETGTVTMLDDDLVIGDSVILVGDGVYNGMFFPKEELEKAYKGWDKVPINIDHSDEKVEDIVGFVDNPQYINDKIVVKPIIDNETYKYPIAMGFIRSRMKAGKIPNVSVGVWVDRVEEELSDGQTRMTARNLEADHLALVVKGACSPENGCGIGIGLSDDGTIYKPEGEVVIPLTPSSEPPITVVVSFEDYVDNDKAYKDLEIEILKERIKKEELKHD